MKKMIYLIISLIIINICFAQSAKLKPVSFELRTTDINIELILNEDSTVNFIEEASFVVPSKPCPNLFYTELYIPLPEEEFDYLIVEDILNNRKMTEVPVLLSSKCFNQFHYDKEENRLTLCFDNTSFIYKIKIEGLILSDKNYSYCTTCQKVIGNNITLKFPREYSYFVSLTARGSENVQLPLLKDHDCGVNYAYDGSIAANMSLFYISNGFVCRGTVFRSPEYTYYQIISLEGWNKVILEKEIEENRTKEQNRIIDKQLRTATIQSIGTIGLLIANVLLVVVTFILVVLTFFSNLEDNDKQLVMLWLRCPDFIVWVANRLKRRGEKRRKKEELKRQKKIEKERRSEEKNQTLRIESEKAQKDETNNKATQ